MTLDVRAAGEALCPSARPESPEAVIFGVVDRAPDGGRPPEVRYLATPIELGARELALLGGASPGAVYRLGARCAGRDCRHFTGSECSLGERLVRLGPAPAEEIPSCALRPGCRWFRERGVAACVRCRWVVSEGAELDGSEALRRSVAAPGG